MDSVQESASGEHQKTPVDVEADVPMLGNNSKLDKQSSNSSSSSSSTSSEEDFFQLDATELSKPAISSSETTHLSSDTKAQSSEATGTTHGTKNPIDDGITLAVNPDPNQASVGRSVSPGIDEAPIGRPSSPDIPISHQALDNLGTTTAMQCPQNQAMARTDVPDPNRIPASIFTRTKSTTPMEWSVASNESLFSIHMGNSSFSRDHVFLLGRSGDLTNFPSGPLDGYPPLPPSQPSSGPVNHGLEQPGMAEAANAETMKDVLRAAAEDKNKPQTESVPHSTSVSRHSDSSITSFRSFAFPILTGDRSGSLKVELEHQTTKSQHQQQPSTPTAAPKAPPVSAPEEKRWFSCFSCSFCC